MLINSKKTTALFIILASLLLSITNGSTRAKFKQQKIDTSSTEKTIRCTACYTSVPILITIARSTNDTKTFEQFLINACVNTLKFVPHVCSGYIQTYKVKTLR